MAAQNYQKTNSQRKPQTNWFLSCFGVHRKTTSDQKKPRKSGGRKKLFKLCLPKLRIIIINKKRSKVGLDKKGAALKASSQNVIVEASKVKFHHVNTNTQEPTGFLKESSHHENRSSKDQLSDAMCHKQDHHESKANTKDNAAPKAKRSYFANKVTRDSLLGVSIMVITLIIMSIWGRMFAILCMSAWFYCMPFFRATNSVVVSNEDNTKLDLDSEVYKKKVVIEGLLQRDHKIARGVS